jgi:hypothetical protein
MVQILCNIIGMYVYELMLFELYAEGHTPNTNILGARAILAVVIPRLHGTISARCIEKRSGSM